MESLEKQGTPATNNFFQYAQVFFALLLFIFAIDLLTVGVGNINGGIALEILNATKNPFISLFIGLLVTALIQSSSTVTASLVAIVASGNLTYNKQFLLCWEQTSVPRLPLPWYPYLI